MRRLPTSPVLASLVLTVVCAASPALAQPAPFAPGDNPFDMNGDGVADLSFFYAPDCSQGGVLRVTALSGGIVAQTTAQGTFATSFVCGPYFGPGLHYEPVADLMSCDADGVAGPLASPGAEAHLIFSVMIGGEPHYGWIFLRHHNSGAYIALTGYLSPYPDDTIYVGADASCRVCDFNLDGDTGTDLDIEDFFACIAGNCCLTCDCADYNLDGDTGTDADIEEFFRVLVLGGC